MGFKCFMKNTQKGKKKGIKKTLSSHFLVKTEFSLFENLKKNPNFLDNFHIDNQYNLHAYTIDSDNLCVN